ncbi:hypothetical protein SAMN05660324_3453 [Klenkia brasiliensis]|uniref:Uncharacterized protein n=1 Tax=Klenkia brasiliensis TaxID=333142 RepID=A0A1G7WPR1_9ACTN|nr:hypothetical protein SAMN05660324_3453 [Klenkia brasiliensis]
MAIAALQAVFCLLPGLNGLSLGLAAGSLVGFVVGGLYLVLSAATVLGSVRLYRGVDVRLLALAGVALVVVWLVNLVLAITVAGTLDVLSVLLLGLAVGVVVLTRKPEVRAWAA